MAETICCQTPTLSNDTQHEDKTHLFIGDLFWRMLICLKQFVEFSNFLVKLV